MGNMDILDKNIGFNGDGYIEQALCSFEEKFCVHLTVHDSRGVLRGPEGKPLLPERNLHRNAYCYSGRHTRPNWNSFCSRDCHLGCEEIMERDQKAFIKKCWKGVWELVVPIVRDDTLMISLFAGVFRKSGTIDPEASPNLPAKFNKLYQELPELPENDIEDLSNSLHLLGLGILSYINQAGNVSDKLGTRKEIIQAFIYQNAHRNIKLTDLAKQLFLSPSRTSHVVKQYFNKSFQELLIQERMQRARVLLVSSDNSIEDICGALGISNVFYFNRLFKNFYGLPPGKFRKEKQR